jgi:hypothetical protein
MLGFDETGTIGTILIGWDSTTGSRFLTLLLIVILIMVAFAVLGLSIEASAIIILPLMLGLMADAATSGTQFYSIGGILIIYLGIILAKNFFFKY